LKTPQLHEREFARILLLKPSALGDVVHTIPVLPKLRARYPGARIDWLITVENADLVREHPDLSGVVQFPRRDYARFGRDWDATVGPIKFLAGLRRTGYDLVIDLHGQFRSAVIALATGAPVRIGFDRPRARRPATAPGLSSPITGPHGWYGAREGAWAAYTHRISIPTLDVHAVDRYLWLAPMLGLDSEPPDFRVYIPAGATERMNELLAATGLDRQPLALLVPGTIWETKHWHVGGFAHVARELLEEGFGVALAGTRADRDRCREIAALAPGTQDLCGRTSVAELAALIQKASVCVTNDSGSMHLSVALGRPVVSVFGPTDPVRIGPYGRPHAVVRADVLCAPCNLRHLRACPNEHACMTKVSGEMVVERVRSELRSHSRGV
jgi:lipopolysaccharide heptosyltransferase I